MRDEDRKGHVPGPHPDAVLLTAGQVAVMLCVSTRTVWRMVEAGRVPQPIRYSRKTLRWVRDEVVAHIGGEGAGRA